ncbi:hypothetical protein [Listeria monocytogenes]|uniref:hypothetical protein n=1 Tax=Listeria monocytogenes TaxID=1639 RepID=UPI00083D18D3|nr:hypothetical protein [Listeria monocytogenes]MBC1287932.1 hypothetical protein [Listeria welshimeri]EAC7689705.1 hypothetical protein [Listeria monocytogenes]EAF9097016.1 hypothetical protein [Listeria monocytogenes]EDN8873720.1 hypothetical protein [Listeria monocytogenes]EHG7524642.1 hypothetical protein [Listeria monocytogenes]
MKPTFSIELFGDYSYVIHDKKDQERILRWYKLGEQKDKPTITFPVDNGRWLGEVTLAWVNIEGIFDGIKEENQ